MLMLKKFLVNLLAFGLVMFGYISFSAFLVLDLSVLSFVLGLVGWYYMGYPSFVRWKQTFASIWKTDN